MRTTKVYIVLNEASLEIAKQKGEVRKFITEADADKWARKNLHLWIVIEVYFKDKHIQHFSNQHLKSQSDEQ